MSVFDESPVATVAVIDTEGDRDTVESAELEPTSDEDVDPERHSVALPDSDAIVADAEGVSRLGAQNGPMLNVGLCVPSIDASEDGDFTGDGEPVNDANAVKTEGVTVNETVTEVVVVVVDDNEPEKELLIETETVGETVRV